MLVTDLSLRMDPVYEKISRRLLRASGSVRGRVCPRVVQAYSPRHGTRSRYLGPEIPKEELIWQDPVPGGRSQADRREGRCRSTRPRFLHLGNSIPEFVGPLWPRRASFRGSDKRGGANGARIRLAPQKDWEVNQPAQLAKVLKTLEAIQQKFNGSPSNGKNGKKGKKVSLADLIVLGGSAAIEKAAKAGGAIGESPSRGGTRTHRKRRPMWSPSSISNRSRTVSATTSRPSSAYQRKSC